MIRFVWMLKLAGYRYRVLQDDHLLDLPYGGVCAEEPDLSGKGLLDNGVSLRIRDDL